MKSSYRFILGLLILSMAACSPAQKANPRGEGTYAVTVTAADFVPVVDNPYYPLVPGTRWVYEAQLADGTVERNEIEVLADTRQIMGVTATVVHDLVYVDGQIAEGTYDWYAQDQDGNVWYLGESVDNYENGQVVNHNGSWEWGKDGALPGILMWADPSQHLNETYRQEYYQGQAEDQGQVQSVTEQVSVPYGMFDQVVKTYDSSLIDRKLNENKFYAMGIGVIKETDITTGEEVVLIEFTSGGRTSAINLPLAPDSQRVDLAEPVFSNPTHVTNPLFPYSRTDQIILLGSVEGQPFHVIYTLMPGTRANDWNGTPVDTIIVQYVAHLNGRIQEYALDWHAQADDGSVWYLGEDVYDYEQGEVTSTDGTWLIGRDGPLAMIMPADPQVGDVFRVENIPGVAFEEVTVTATNVTVQGPNGPIEGAMVARELHMDGSYSNKTFAPGYGEFVTINGGELEALALAIPPDAETGPVPSELDTLTSGALRIFDSATTEDWNTTGEVLNQMVTAWEVQKTRSMPIMLASQLGDAMNVLIAAANTRQPAEAKQAVLNLGLAGFDLQLQYLPPTEVDLARFRIMTMQVLVDVEAGNPGGVRSDTVTLELTRDRFIHTLGGNVASKINALLADLRTAADSEDLRTAGEIANQLTKALK
jgi:hypothetical protein